MEITVAKSTKLTVKEENSIPLSLYWDAPYEELTLDEFELLSLDRLQLLRSIEQMKLRGFDDNQFISKIRDVSLYRLLC